MRRWLLARNQRERAVRREAERVLSDDLYARLEEERYVGLGLLDAEEFANGS